MRQVTSRSKLGTGKGKKPLKRLPGSPFRDHSGVSSASFSSAFFLILSWISASRSPFSMALCQRNENRKTSVRVLVAMNYLGDRDLGIKKAAEARIRVLASAAFADRTGEQNRKRALHSPYLAMTVLWIFPISPAKSLSNKELDFGNFPFHRTVTDGNRASALAGISV